MSIVRLKPYQWIHIHDNNANVTRVLVGPDTYTCLDHERLVQPEPVSSIAVPPGCYAVIKNPVARDKDGKVLFAHDNQVKIRTGHTEIRFEQEPFALFPGEELVGDVKPKDVLGAHQALRLYAIQDFTADDKTVRKAGDEWLLNGPCTYTPRVEVEVRGKVDAIVVDHSTAIRLQAVCNFTDANGISRITGEEWLYDTLGAFIPPVEARVVEVVKAEVLTEKSAIHVQALGSFRDRFNVERAAGDKWLVSVKNCASFIPSPFETIIARVPLTVVGAHQYCVVEDFIESGTGVQRIGKKELRKGTTSFFLHPGETLVGGGVSDKYMLERDQGLVLFANEAFTDADGVKRAAGDRWMIQGPRDFIPPVAVRVLERRRAIPLDLNEGVYIRDRTTGVVRAHIGSTVMLKAEEELWSKPLAPLVEELLARPRLTKNMASNDSAVTTRRRKPYEVVTCNVPHNAVVQVYDYKRKCARVVVGPELVALQPDEEFTVASLSGGKPKQADMLKALALHLGPDFMTDVLLVETKDHARLQLQLSFNWEFDVSASDMKEKIFNVPDFVGDACKAIASRIRGAVAAESFDQFHRNSTTIIRRAVFGKADNYEPLRFKNNGLIITSVDIHSVDPVDPKTREALQKSVQLAIEITTKSQEAVARHLATTKEQIARGKLERQVIQDKAKAEEIRKQLLAILATNAAIESTGSSTAQAKANAEAKEIEGLGEVEVAQLRAGAETVMMSAEIDVLRQQHENEIEYTHVLNELEIARERELAKIEADKFKRTINAIGKNTIIALARAGPKLQARLLGALGLQGYLVTDGSNPINLFNTAKGLANQGAAAAAAATTGRH